MKRIFSALFAVLLLILSVFPAATASFADITDTAEEIPDEVSHAKSVYLYNIDSSTLLYEKNSGAQVDPSSTARMMLAIIVIEKYDNLDITLTVSSAAFKKARLTDCNKMGLVSGEMITARSLLYGLIMFGAHDAAYALAENAFGSSKKAVTEMNKKAEELGMRSTRYVNITGEKDDGGGFTCASDVALLAVYAFSNPIFTDIARQTYVNVARLGRSGLHTIYTQNYLQSKRTLTDYYDPCVTGMNAAGIDHVDRTRSGYCCVATAEIENLNYLCVVMDAENKAEDGSAHYFAFTIPSKLFEWAKKNFAFRDVLSSNIIFGEIKVSLATDSDYVSVVPSRKLEAFLPRTQDIDELVNTEVTMYYEELQAPVEEGMVVGKVVVSMSDTVVCEADLVTKNSLNLSKWQANRAMFTKLAKTKRFKWICAAVIAAAVIAVLLTARIKYVRKNRISVHVREK